MERREDRTGGGVTNRPISRDDEVLRLIRSSLKVPLRFHSPRSSAASLGPACSVRRIFRSFQNNHRWNCHKKYKTVCLSTSKNERARVGDEVGSLSVGCPRLMGEVETFGFLLREIEKSIGILLVEVF